MSSKKKQDEKVLISLEVTVEQREQLKKLAEAHERSYSFILRKLAEQAIAVGEFDLVGYRKARAQSGAPQGGGGQGGRNAPLAGRHRASDV